MIFFRTEFQFQETILLSKEELEHLRSLRLYQEDKILEFRNGLGKSFFYSVKAKANLGDLVKSEINTINEKSFSIASAIPQNNRLDFLLQKNTEIGINSFYFINFFQSERREINIERSHKIILEACIQSKRHSVPSIKLYPSLEKFLIENPKSFFLNPKAKQGINEVKDWKQIPIIGPEGGFREQELALIQDQKISEYNLGTNILKIETASIYIASVLQFNIMAES
jgi:16S rRNA (uracil1498-N3)-methyltransferase